MFSFDMSNTANYFVFRMIRFECIRMTVNVTEFSSRADKIFKLSSDEIRVWNLKLFGYDNYFSEDCGQ